MNTALRDLVAKTIGEKGYKASAVATAIGYSAPSLSQYLSGKYPAGVTKIEKSLATWLRRESVSVEPAETNAYVETAATMAVANACTEAQEEGQIAVIIGAPGTGKTVGLEKWCTQARLDGLRFLLLTANVVTSPVALLRRLAERLGITRGSASDLLDLIIDKLTREPAILLIDEAQHLNARALEVVRAIHDATLSGVVFAGSLALSRTLDEGDGTTAELAQIQDRVGRIERLKTLSPLEVTRFYQRATGSEIADPTTMSLIREVSGGVPRKLARLLTHCSRLSAGSNRPISAEMVREASTRLVRAAA